MSKNLSNFGNRQLESIGKFRFIKNLNYTKRAKYLFLREQDFSYGIIAKLFNTTPAKIWKSVNSKSKPSAGTIFALECLNRMNDSTNLHYYKKTAIYQYLLVLHDNSEPTKQKIYVVTDELTLIKEGYDPKTGSVVAQYISDLSLDNPGVEYIPVLRLVSKTTKKDS